MARKTYFWTPLTQKLSKRQLLSAFSGAAASLGFASATVMPRNIRSLIALRLR